VVLYPNAGENGVNVIQETLAHQVYRIAPQGRMDAVTVPSLEAVIDEHLAAGHIRLIIDLAAVTYISSSGLRALLRARRQAQSGGGDVALCDMSARVTEVFDMIGFNNLFRIFPHATEAAAALAQVATV
jgi:anti-sigma B factor antagonist